MNKTFIETVKALFGLSLMFKVQVSYKEALLILDGQDSPITDILVELAEWLPRVDFGAGNPNNGNLDGLLRLSIGREYSPVVYIDVDRFYNKTMPTTYAIQDKIEELGKKYGADEISFEKTNEKRFVSARLWWD